MAKKKVKKKKAKQATEVIAPVIKDVVLNRLIAIDNRIDRIVDAHDKCKKIKDL